MNTAPTVPPPSLASGEIAPGHVLGRYELLLPIAAGGMAMVWAARVRGTRGFQKIVAIKTMLSKLTEDEQFEQMFLAEASLASQIRHPNVVEISDLGEQDGVLYLAMEWIDGVPLNQLMKTAKAAGSLVPLAIAVRIVMNACAGLHAAHELRDAKGQLVGLVHRDVSPQNILVTYDGVSKVVDFGVAKATAMGGGATVAGQLKGKVSYMAPEQVRGEEIDRRVDIFAMGIVLYALTTGKHPFRRESEAATMYTIASDDPVISPRKFLPDYPVSLEAVLLKSLSKDAQGRYATASEFLRALDQCLPAAERANTDEDIGQFIVALFGSKREESRAALAEALALADQHGARTGHGPVNPHTQSQVSTVSEMGAGTAAESSVESMFSTVAGPPEVTQRRTRILLFSVFGVILVVGALLIASRNSGSDQTPRPAASTAQVAEGEKASQALAPKPPAAEPRVSTKASAAASTPPRSVNPAPKFAPPPTTVVTPAKPPKPLTPKWREDPGF